MAMEQFRWDVSPMSTEGIGFASVTEINPLTEFSRLWPLVFPEKVLPRDAEKWLDQHERCIHDVMRIANAEDGGADVFLTDEKALLDAGPRLGLRVRIMKPEQLVEELEGKSDV